MFEISVNKGLCEQFVNLCELVKAIYVSNLSSEVKTSDLAARFHAILALQIRFCLLFKRSTNIQGWQN